MVEDTSLKVDPKSCQLNISINTLLTSAKEKLKLQEIENWGDTAKKLKRRSEDILNNVHKKAKGENGEQPDVELQEEEEAFQWSAYLKEKNATAVSKSLFRHIVPECMCGFEAGMKLEVPNKDYKNTYWLATIVTKASPLILVRYEGFHDSSECDFWCNTLTDDIHPVGWCARTKHALKPPKAIQHKEKNWYTYLIKNLTGARKASENLFLRKSHPAHYLRAGQYVEVIDQYNPTCYWLARINEVFSGRLFLQYEGWVDKNGEFCCYYLDESLRAVGYGMRHGLTLYPPKGSGPFSHVQFNQITEKIVTHSKRSDNSIFKALFSGWRNPKEHKLSLGMKLEAVHPLDPTNICVASVARVFDAHHFLVKIDDLIATQEEIANCFIAHKGSAGIFEIGFCHKNGLPLQQPRGYNGKFTWEGYLKYTKSLAAPTEFFGEVETFDQKLLDVGMKLEAVDLENKSNICVCTISRIVGPNIWLKIDGDTRIEQIHSITSTDVFPVDWCESTGHELQWPRLNTLEQKNRISSLRHTATRKNRLEVLRKGKLREKSNDGKEVGNKKEVNQKQKRSKDRYSNRGRRRGVSRNPTAYDNSASDNSPIDTSIAIVCISRLANELNSEESIKEAFHLDAQGRLPRQVVTIDDDDDDIIVKEEKLVKKYDEKDLDYFSVIRVKPNDLTKIEEEMFEKKLQENEANQGLDMDAANNTGASGSREKRSLSSVVAMLRASRKQPQLLDYKPDSSKHSTEPVSETSKPSTDNILIGDQDLTSLRTDAPIRIPGKGDFQVVEKIVSQEGGKNKITLKLGKPINTANSNPVINNSPVGRSQDSTTPVGNLPKTDIKNMHELTNMARSHKGLDEILRNRCAKVRSFCRNLPKNPLLWTKNHVATFIKTADCAKYSNLFVKQEIDGHSFLLLTVQELHHVLGIHLGPAMKIHDYIFTLQQLVNEAYQNSKAKLQKR